MPACRDIWDLDGRFIRMTNYAFGPVLWLSAKPTSSALSPGWIWLGLDRGFDVLSQTLLASSAPRGRIRRNSLPDARFFSSWVPWLERSR